MKSLSSVGLGLSVVFGCLLLALVAEVYYLLWWKKRITNRDIESDYRSPVKELFYMFCWKRPSSLRHSALNPGELCNSMRISETLVHNPEGQFQSQANNKDFVFKPFGQDSMEEEYMRQHDLSGPPRFLFTIVEETKEDLESEDAKSRGDLSGKGSRGRSLNDLLFTVETPYLTPMASPPFFTPPLTPMAHYNHHGFNPLFESATDAEFNRMKSSPPPKFKFLQDAEEKLRRKLKEESEGNGDGEVDDSNFITVIVDRKRDTELNHHSNTSQPKSDQDGRRVCRSLINLHVSQESTTELSDKIGKRKIELLLVDAFWAFSQITRDEVTRESVSLDINRKWLSS